MPFRPAVPSLHKPYSPSLRNPSVTSLRSDMSTQESMRLSRNAAESQPPRRPGLILAFLCLAGFMTFLDVSIVNVALPTIEDELHISQTSLQYIVTTYGMLLGGFLLLTEQARRRLRPPPDAPDRPDPVRPLLPARRARAERGHADRGARRPGPGGGVHRDRRAVPARQQLRGGRRTQQGPRCLGRAQRYRRRRRCHPGRSAHRRARLALDLLHQRADRPGLRPDRPEGHRREPCGRAQQLLRRRRLP